MSKKILVLSANPRKNSFINHLACVYADAADKNHQVKRLDISDMQFILDLSAGYKESMLMEDPLQEFQAALEWCEHLVILTPIWWGAVPAKLKGLIDRTFLPGFAFQYEQGKLIPKKLLQGKTARIIMTMDTPPWYYIWVQGAPALKQLKKTTLEFVGFHSIKNNMLGPIINSTQDTRTQWIQRVSKLGFEAS
ncbi:NAD(P)H-dependent oxidoreductase [Shewanella sp. HL-SH8]|uniref:NAD(P)H-dependent oxidoreductase n=1 Tax=Shewanella sp. HL-SH8 TaxID=3436242 RepID=UPI003EB92CC9